MADPNARIKELQTVLSAPIDDKALKQDAAAAILRQADNLREPYERAEAARNAALYATEGTPLSKQAIDVWSENIDKIQDAVRRIEYISYAIGRAPHDSESANAAISKWEENVKTSDGSAQFGAVLYVVREFPEDHKLTALAVPIIFSYIEKLPSPEQRVKAAHVAVLSSRKGEFHASVLALWEKHATSLERPEQLFIAVKNATQQSGMSSDCNYNRSTLQVAALKVWSDYIERQPSPQKRQEVALYGVKNTDNDANYCAYWSLRQHVNNTWEKAVNALPEVTDRIEIAKTAMRHGKLRGTALKIIRDNIDKLPQSLQRREAALFIAQQTTNDSVVLGNAIKKWSAEVGVMPDPEERLAAAKEAIQGPFGKIKEVRGAAIGVILNDAGNVANLAKRVEFLELAIALSDQDSIKRRAEQRLEALREGHAYPSERAAKNFVGQLRIA